jgi:hypothetical protein
MRIDVRVLDGLAPTWVKVIGYAAAAAILAGIGCGFMGWLQGFAILGPSGLVLFVVAHVLTGWLGRCGICGGRVVQVQLSIAPADLEVFKAAPRKMSATPRTSATTGWYAVGYRCRSCTSLGIISLGHRGSD